MERKQTRKIRIADSDGKYLLAGLWKEESDSYPYTYFDIDTLRQRTETKNELEEDEEMMFGGEMMRSVGERLWNWGRGSLGSAAGSPHNFAKRLWGNTGANRLHFEVTDAERLALPIGNLKYFSFRPYMDKGGYLPIVKEAPKWFLRYDNKRKEYAPSNVSGGAGVVYKEVGLMEYFIRTYFSTPYTDCGIGQDCDRFNKLLIHTWYSKNRRRPWSTSHLTDMYERRIDLWSIGNIRYGLSEEWYLIPHHKDIVWGGKYGEDPGRIPYSFNKPFFDARDRDGWVTFGGTVIYYWGNLLRQEVFPNPEYENKLPTNPETSGNSVFIQVFKKLTNNIEKFNEEDINNLEKPIASEVLNDVRDYLLYYSIFLDRLFLIGWKFTAKDLEEFTLGKIVLYVSKSPYEIWEIVSEVAEGVQRQFVGLTEDINGSFYVTYIGNSDNNLQPMLAISRDEGRIWKNYVMEKTIITDVDSLVVNRKSTNTFQVKLATDPGKEVKVAVKRVSGNEEVTIKTGEELIFTVRNWDEYQIVTVAVSEKAETDAAIIRCTLNLCYSDVTIEVEE